MRNINSPGKFQAVIPSSNSYEKTKVITYLFGCARGSAQVLPKVTFSQILFGRSLSESTSKRLIGISIRNTQYPLRGLNLRKIN